ncbi:MAG: hypothetical protein K0B07_03005 [DPANN group archaeon]|nr:hypothetical protein [DPANN group archaeon]
MLRAKTVGYCKCDGLDVYTDKIDNDVFDAAIALFSRRLGVYDMDCASAISHAGKVKKEYTFSSLIGRDGIEVSYNPDTRLMVLGAKDRSQIEQFLSCVPGRSIMYSNDSYDGFDISEGVLKGNCGKVERGWSIFNFLKKLLRSLDGASKGYEVSVLDNNPSAYHFLEDREKRLVDSYESQLLDMERYVVRKNIVVSYISKVNRSLEDVAQMAEKYTVAEEKGLDAHDKLIEAAQFWKELDYVPSY